VRPVAAHLLEGRAADQERVGRFALLGQRGDDVGLVEVLVAGRGEPALGGVDDAVEGDVLGDDQVAMDAAPRATRPCRA